MSGNTLLIDNARIISPDFDLAGGAVLVAEGMIRRLFAPGDELPAAEFKVDLGGRMLMPGFIDIHTHGRSGFEFTDGDSAHLATMCADKLGEGVTSWLPTTLTLGREELRRALSCARSHVASGVPGARMPGVHLEGPYINSKCLGAQNPAFVREPDIEEVLELHAIFPVLKVSYAVEVPGGDQIGRASCRARV